MTMRCIYCRALVEDGENAHPRCEQSAAAIMAVAEARCEQPNQSIENRGGRQAGRAEARVSRRGEVVTIQP
jgi:hypothetical protein